MAFPPGMNSQVSVLLSVINTPERYGIVESGVYRASSLTPHSLPFVSTLQLKTLLHLSSDAPAAAVVSFLQQSSIQLIHLGARQAKPASWKPVSENLISEALELVLDATMHPVMITCSSGIQQTGTLVGCLRRLQNWSLTSIMEEYRRFAGKKSHYANEQFMELFDPRLVKLPKNLASWFADQQRLMEEEMKEFEKQKQASESNNSTRQALQEFRTCSSYARYFYSSNCPLSSEAPRLRKAE